MRQSDRNQSSSPHQPVVDRRAWLEAIIGAVGAGIAAVLGVVVGGAVLAPGTAAPRETWAPAGRLRDLEEGVPLPVTIRRVRRDGYAEAVDRQVVFLVKSQDGQVTALSSTCTHLGCRVGYDPDANVLKCPCHGGAYDAAGRVIAGPPPRPLEPVAARVEGAQVFVRL